MIAGRSDIVDIFRRWMSDRVPIRWQGSFASFAFGSWGFIVLADDVGVRLETGDKQTSLDVHFKNVIEFDYADARSVTGTEKRFEECIIMRFSDISHEDDTPDTIALGALGSLGGNV